MLVSGPLILISEAERCYRCVSVAAEIEPRSLRLREFL